MHGVTCSACEAVAERKKELKEPVPGLHLYPALPDGFDIVEARTTRAEAMAAELAGK